MICCMNVCDTCENKTARVYIYNNQNMKVRLMFYFYLVLIASGGRERDRQTSEGQKMQRSNNSVELRKCGDRIHSL